MRKALALLWLVLVLAACGHVAWVARHGLPVQTDLMALLPREERDPEIGMAKDRMAELLSRRVVVMVGHSDRAVARAQAAALRRALTGAGLISPATDIPAPDALRRLGAAYFPHRAGLLAESDRARLLKGRGDVLETRALSQMFGFAGAVDSRLLARDPFLLFPAFLTGLSGPSNRLALDDGMLSVTEGGTTWVMESMVLAGSSHALDVQKRFGTVMAAARSAAPEGTRWLRLGALFYAQAGAEQALDESARIGLGSVVGAVLLLVLVFRSGRPLVLSLLALGAGMVAALSACLLLFGTLHVAAQLFGASLIGIAVDYALLYFGQIFTPRSHPAERLAKVLPGMALGAGCTIIGYGTLALSPFPGLTQVAVFSAVGLAGALASVVLWFPLADRNPSRPLPAWAHGAALALWRWPERRRLSGAVLAVLATLVVLGAVRLETDDDMRRQQGLSPPLVAEQAEIQRLAGFGTSGRFFLVKGADGQQALEREEALSERLKGLGVGWQAVSRYVPSARRQTDNAALAQRELYAPRLAAYGERLGMTEPAGTSLPEQPLLPEDIRAIGAFPFLDALVVAPGLHVVTLDGDPDPVAAEAAAQGLDGVRFVDTGGDFNRLLRSYRLRALAQLGVSLLVMAPLLLWRYGLRRAVRVLLPAGAAVLATPPLLALAGIGFSFFAAMALVLVLSIGIDYAVFCAEDGEHDPATLVSVCLAMLTTLLSFGLLALSGVVAVRAFGGTMLVGVALAFLLAPSVGRRSS